jgi:hypothetical protein
MNSQVKKIHFSKKWRNWDSTHRRKSADIIDPVQKQKFRKKTKKTNKSKVQKSEKEEIGKSKYKSTKFAKRLHNTSCIFAALSQLQTCTPVSKRNR